MTTAHKVTVGLAVLLAVLLGIAGWAYVQDKVALARHEEQTKANGSAVKGLEDANDALAKQLKASLDGLDRLRVGTTTTREIVQAAPQVITLPAPVREVTKEQAALPESPVKQGDVIIPAESAKAWFDAQVTCRENAAKLDACEKTAANDAAIIAVKDKQIAEDQVVIKGGTKGQRFRTALKWGLIGAGIGVGAGLAVKH